MVFLYFAGYLWMKILKAINNNIVSARDENGKEIVVMGRGIGFKCREGDSIPPEAIEKIFHMDTQNETDRLKQLFSSMPLEHIEVTNRIIAYARKILGKRLNHSIYITLTDHISFSVLRFRQNMMFHNALLAEMRRFYPQEYSIGQYALDLIAKELGVRFPDDEAASIAMHIVNAEYDISLGEAVDITHLIAQMLRIVRDWHRRRNRLRAPRRRLSGRHAFIFDRRSGGGLFGDPYPACDSAGRVTRFFSTIRRAAVL